MRPVHWFYLELVHMVVKWRQRYIKETSSCHVASQRIQELMGAFKNKQTKTHIKCGILWWARKRINYSCEGRIEKNTSLGITVCHHSANLMMPNGDPRDGLFYPTLTLLIDSYSLLNLRNKFDIYPVLCYKFVHFARTFVAPKSSVMVQLYLRWCSKESVSVKPILSSHKRRPKVGFQSKCGRKDQESIQLSTTPDPGYQWESDKLTVIHHKREPRGQFIPSRWPQGTNKQTRTKA